MTFSREVLTHMPSLSIMIFFYLRSSKILREFGPLHILFPIVGDCVAHHNGNTQNNFITWQFPPFTICGFQEILLLLPCTWLSFSLPNFLRMSSFQIYLHCFHNIHISTSISFLRYNLNMFFLSLLFPFVRVLYIIILSLINFFALGICCQEVVDSSLKSI